VAGSGETIENPVTGERITWLETASDSGGESLAFELYLRAGASVSAEHRHVRQIEQFSVVAGSLRVTVDGRESDLEVGDSPATSRPTRTGSPVCRRSRSRIATSETRARGLLARQSLFKTRCSHSWRPLDGCSASAGSTPVTVPAIQRPEQRRFAPRPPQPALTVRAVSVVRASCALRGPQEFRVERARIPVRRRKDRQATADQIRAGVRWSIGYRTRFNGPMATEACLRDLDRSLGVCRPGRSRASEAFCGCARRLA
jgi:hypothetical protein